MRSLTLIIAIAFILTAAVGSTVMAESWSSFKDVTFYGVSIYPDLGQNKLEYTIALNPGATVSFDGHAYEIQWISAFYVRSVDAANFFAATDDAGANDWSWEQDPTHGSEVRVAGWKSRGDGDRLHVGPGAWKKFRFGSFDLGATAVNAGFHIGYLDDRGKMKTDFLAGVVPTGQTGHAPEPSGLIAGLTFAAGLAGMAKRRFRSNA